MIHDTLMNLFLIGKSPTAILCCQDHHVGKLTVFGTVSIMVWFFRVYLIFFFFKVCLKLEKQDESRDYRASQALPMAFEHLERAPWPLLGLLLHH